MKYEFFIDKKRQVLFERFEGKITYQDFIDAVKESYDHPDWHPGQNVLCDLRGADLALSSDEMVQFVRSFSPDDQANKLAMIVSREVEFGMSRMFQIISEETEIWKEYKIFYNVSKALQWLGIEYYPGLKDLKWLT